MVERGNEKDKVTNKKKEKVRDEAILKGREKQQKEKGNGVKGMLSVYISCVQIHSPPVRAR